MQLETMSSPSLTRVADTVGVGKGKVRLPPGRWICIEFMPFDRGASHVNGAQCERFGWGGFFWLFGGRLGDVAARRTVEYSPRQPRDCG